MKIRCLDLGGSDFLIYNEDMAGLFSEHRSTANHGIHIKENRKLTENEIEILLEEAEKMEVSNEENEENEEEGIHKKPEDEVILNKIIKLYPEVKYLVHGFRIIEAKEPVVKEPVKDMTDEEIMKEIRNISKFFSENENTVLSEEELNTLQDASKRKSIPESFRKYASDLLSWYKGVADRNIEKLEKSYEEGSTTLKEIKNAIRILEYNLSLYNKNLPLAINKEKYKEYCDLLAKYKVSDPAIQKKIDDILEKTNSIQIEDFADPKDSKDSKDVENINKKIKQIYDFLKKKIDYDSLDKREFKKIYDTATHYENDLFGLKNSPRPKVADIVNQYLDYLKKYKKKMEKSSNFESSMLVPSNVSERERYYKTKLEEISNIITNKPVSDKDRQDFQDSYDSYYDILNRIKDGGTEISDTATQKQSEELLEKIKGLKIEIGQEEKKEEEEIRKARERAKKQVDEEENRVVKKGDKPKYTGYKGFLFNIFDTLKTGFTSKTEKEKLQEYLRRNWDAYQKNKAIVERNADLFNDLSTSLKEGEVGLKSMLLFNEIINRDPSWLDVIDTETKTPRFIIPLRKFQKIKIEPKDTNENIKKKIQDYVSKNKSSSLKNKEILFKVNKEKGIVEIETDWTTGMDALETFDLKAKDITSIK